MGATSLGGAVPKRSVCYESLLRDPRKKHIMLDMARAELGHEMNQSALPPAHSLVTGLTGATPVGCHPTRPWDPAFVPARAVVAPALAVSLAHANAGLRDPSSHVCARVCARERTRLRYERPCRVYGTNPPPPPPPRRIHAVA